MGRWYGGPGQTIVWNVKLSHFSAGRVNNHYQPSLPPSLPPSPPIFTRARGRVFSLEMNLKSPMLSSRSEGYDDEGEDCVGKSRDWAVASVPS